jgi:hypothetical protein
LIAKDNLYSNSENERQRNKENNCKVSQARFSDLKAFQRTALEKLDYGIIYYSQLWNERTYPTNPFHRKHVGHVMGLV